MRPGSLVLAVCNEGGQPHFIEAFADDHEIEVFESACRDAKEDHPIQVVKAWRVSRRAEEEQFGDYVEDLLSQPFLRHEVRSHGLQWLSSKMRIDKLSVTEREATKVIAEFAFRVFCDHPEHRQFYLMGNQSKVKVRVFEVPKLPAAGGQQDVA